MNATFMRLPGQGHGSGIMRLFPPNPWNSEPARPSSSLLSRARNAVSGLQSNRELPSPAFPPPTIPRTRHRCIPIRPGMVASLRNALPHASPCAASISQLCHLRAAGVCWHRCPSFPLTPVEIHRAYAPILPVMSSTQHSRACRR